MGQMARGVSRPASVRKAWMALGLMVLVLTALGVGETALIRGSWVLTGEVLVGVIGLMLGGFLWSLLKRRVPPRTVR